MKSVIVYLLAIFFLVSCTVHKRKHRPGWHVQWNSKTQTSKAITKKSPKQLASNDVDIEKSSEELSEVTYELKKEEANSVELGENQPEAEVPLIEPTNYGDDGPLSEEKLYEVLQKEGELDTATEEKPKNSNEKSKNRRTLGILFLVLACICLIVTIIFLSTSFGLNELSIAIIVAIFGFLFFLLGTSLLGSSKKVNKVE